MDGAEREAFCIYFAMQKSRQLKFDHSDCIARDHDVIPYITMATQIHVDGRPTRRLPHRRRDALLQHHRIASIV